MKPFLLRGRAAVEVPGRYADHGRRLPDPPRNQGTQLRLAAAVLRRRCQQDEKAGGRARPETGRIPRQVRCNSRRRQRDGAGEEGTEGPAPAAVETTLHLCTLMTGYIQYIDLQTLRSACQSGSMSNLALMKLCNRTFQSSAFLKIIGIYSHVF